MSQADYQAYRHLLRTLKGVRPTEPRGVPLGLEMAYRAFEILLAEVLLRTSANAALDARALRSELQQTPIATCFRRWLCEWEFEAIIGTVLHLGPQALTDEGLVAVWRPLAPETKTIATAMVREILQWLTDLHRVAPQMLDDLVAAAAARSVTDPAQLRATRPEGRPRSPAAEGLCVLVLREELFPRVGRSLPRALIAAEKLMPHQWKRSSLRRRCERLRKTEVAIPATWGKTLLARRIEPFYGNYLEVTPQALAWAKRQRAQVQKPPKPPT